MEMISGDTLVLQNMIQSPRYVKGLTGPGKYVLQDMVKVHVGMVNVYLDI
jgi:hypothetical protein